MKNAIALLAAGMLVFAGASPGLAAPCKDAKGKFIKCVKVVKKGPCKDAKGKFIKCK